MFVDTNKKTVLNFGGINKATALIIARLIVLTCMSVFFGAGLVFAEIKMPDLSELGEDAIASINLACATSKYKGPAQYSRCLNDQISQMKTAPEMPRRQSAEPNTAATDSNVQPDSVVIDIMHKQLENANAELAKTKQKLAAANEKEANLNAKLMTSLLAQYDFTTTIRELRKDLDRATDALS